MLNTFAFFDNGVKFEVARGIMAVSFCYTSSLIVLITVLLALALAKFIKIVSKVKARRDMNTCFIFLQVIALVVWSILWIIEGVYFIKHYKHFGKFEPVRNVVIADAVGIVTNLLNFAIVALVIYRSSSAVNLNENLSLIAYLQQAKVSEQQHSISQDMTCSDESYTNDRHPNHVSPHFADVSRDILYSTNDNECDS